MRRFAFALSVLLAFSAVLLSFCGCAFLNRFDVYEDAELYTAGSFLYDAEEVHTVRVYWVSGSVSISPSDKASLTGGEDSGSLDEGQQMRWLLRDGVLTVRFCESGYRGRIKDSEKNLELQIPDNVELSVETVSANLDLGYLTGKAVTISTVSGNITAAGIVGETVDVSSVSGNIGVSKLCADHLKASAVSGNMRLLAVSAPEMVLSTVSGEMTLALDADTEAKLNSTSGDIRLYKGAIGMSLTFDTASGDLDTALTYEKTAKNQYRFEEGTSRILVETVSGDLFIGWSV